MGLWVPSREHERAARIVHQQGLDGRVVGTLRRSRGITLTRRW